MPAVPNRPAAKPAQRQPQRRFEDKPDLDPAAVWSLPKSHAAITQSRTLFPSTVVTVDESFEGRLLISGKNNRKLGDKITKGKFKGYALYCLSLEERATCPKDCSMFSACYGNSMQLARRHRIADLDYFFTLMDDEIREILETEDGLMIRLHVLGDFPSVDYVEWWNGLLERHPNLAVFGYTHRRPTERGGDKIGDTIEDLKLVQPERFRIRWSTDKPRADSAIVLDHIPDGPKYQGAIVCPAQRDATACCASCGLCWEANARLETIAFVKHGPKSSVAAAETAAASKTPGSTHHPVTAISLPSGTKPALLSSVAPTIRLVKPQSLLIESAYQRDLSGKSIQLIRKIVGGWDWTKFKPPVCAETKDGLVVIDGQHTAIAAATHPGITEIPVMINATAHLERRAAAFVSHNRDRLVMTPAQIFYGDLAAGDKDCKGIMECVVKAGASIPRLPVGQAGWKAGQISAVGEIRDAFKRTERATVEKMLRISVASKVAPVSKTLLRALRSLLTEEQYRKVRLAPEAAVVSAIVSLGDISMASEKRAAESGLSRFSACADLIAEALK